MHVLEKSQLSQALCKLFKVIFEFVNLFLSQFKNYSFCLVTHFCSCAADEEQISQCMQLLLQYSVQLIEQQGKLELAVASLTNASSDTSKFPQSSDVFTRQTYNGFPNVSLKTVRNSRLGISSHLEMLFKSTVTDLSSGVVSPPAPQDQQSILLYQPYHLYQILGNGDQLGR